MPIMVCSCYVATCAYLECHCIANYAYMASDIHMYIQGVDNYVLNY